MQVQTLSLANNNIQSGKDISSIGMFLPKLANLSLANNQLKTMEDIRQLTREKNKLDLLRELVLTGNPIKGNDPANTEQYRRFVPVVKLQELFTSSRLSTETSSRDFPLWRYSITNGL